MGKRLTPKRDIGKEILDGIRGLKAGRHGRITHVPFVSAVPKRRRAVGGQLPVYHHLPLANLGDHMDNMKLMKDLYDAFGKGDIPTVLGAMAPDIKWHQAESNPYRPSGEPWIGPDAVLQNLFMKLGAEWDGFALQLRSFHNAGGTVIVEGRYNGTYKATGKSMNAQFCHIWDIKDGKVTRFQQYVDTEKLNDIIKAN